MMRYFHKTYFLLITLLSCAFIAHLSCGVFAYTQTGKILFSSNRDGDNELYSTNIDGSNIIQLTHNTTNEVGGNWSPDGSRIAFVSDADGDKEIFVANADGSNPVQLTDNTFDEGWIDWSPDGTKLAFASNRSGNYDVWSMNLSGGNVIQLTNNSGLERSPGWSPDGAKIIFTAKYGQTFQIYVSNLDGTNKINLSNNAFNDQAAAWSSESNKIIFRSDRDGDLEIFSMNVDGTGQTKLTNNSFEDQGPVWSSDGSAIGFRSDRDGNPELYLMNADGTNQTRVTNHASTDFDASIFNGTTSPPASPTPIATVTPQATQTPTQTPAPTTTQAPGNPADVDENGTVNLADLQAIKTNFNRTQFSIRDPQPDGKITIFDFSIVVKALYAQNPGATPTTGPSPTEGPTPTAGATPTPTPPQPTPLNIPGEMRILEWNKPAEINHSGFLVAKPAPDFAQGNWVSPDNFSEGKLYFRAQINGIPVEQPGMKLGFCFWQGTGPADPLFGEECASSEPVAGVAGTNITWTRNMADLNPIENNPIDWTQDRWQYGIVVRNEYNKPVSKKRGMNWNGEDPTHWYPLNIRFTVVVVKKNQAFSGWDNYDW